MRLRLTSKGEPLPVRLALWWAVLVFGAATAAAAVLVTYGLQISDWWLVALFYGGTILTSFQIVRGLSVNYSANVIFFVGGALTLPPGFVALLALPATALDAARRRPGWYQVIGNPANLTLSCLGAWGAHGLVERLLTGHSTHLATALATAVGAGVFILVNYGLLGFDFMLRSPRKFLAAASRDTLSLECAFAASGGIVAALAVTNPLMIPVALVPILYIQKLVTMPALVEETRIDSKTRLYNMHHFAEQLDVEIERSLRYGRPLSVVAADVDHFRAINNSYGHIAADEVLVRVAAIIGEEIRRSDLAARFGGEEFLILLPETRPESAWALAERIRERVEAEEFAEGLRATLSLGVASLSVDALDATGLLKAADAALYEAKREGRNRVCVGMAVLAQPPVHTMS